MACGKAYEQENKVQNKNSPNLSIKNKTDFEKFTNLLNSSEEKFLSRIDKEIDHTG